MVIRWDSESDWENNQDSSGTVGRNGHLKQGYSRERPELSNGLVGYWPLHDNSATDYSGNRNHGSLNGGVTTGVAGRGGLQAMSFDGNDDYIDISKSVSSEFGSGSFTVMAWVKTDSSGRVLDNRNESSGFAGIVMNISNGKIVLSIDDGSNAEIVREGSIDIRDGRWHHVVVMRDNSSNDLRIFLDGEEDTESTYTDTSGGNLDSYGSVSHNRNTQIGAEYVTSDNNAAGHIEGAISDVRVYGGALSSSEVQTVYRWGSGDFARPPDQDGGGVAYWPLDGNADDSWSSNDGNVSGAVYSDAVRNQGLRFDGDNDSVKITSSELDISESKTVSTWFRMDGVSANKAPRIFQTGTGSSNRAYEVWVNDEKNEFGRVVLRINNDQSPSSKYVSHKIDGFGYNQWYHLTTVYDYSAGQMRLFINGVLKSSSSYSEQIGSETDHYIGNWSEGGSRPWNGKIDDIRVYVRALSSREIFELYRYGTRGRDLRRQLVNY